MALGLGLRLGLANNVNTLKRTTFNFTSILPDGFASVRSSTGGTARDIAGNWQEFAVNTARFDHNASGIPQGVMIEPSNVTLANHANFNISNIGGVTVETGTGASVTLVDDTAKLALSTIAGSDFSALGNNNVIRLSSGPDVALFRISLDIGAGKAGTPHSFRVVYRTEDTGYQGSIRISDGQGQTFFITDTNYHEMITENISPNSDTRYLQAVLTANKTIYIKATQFENNAYISYPIITTGNLGNATASDYLLASDLGNKSWWNDVEGAMVGEFDFLNLDNSEQYAMLASTGGGLTNAVGMYLLGGNNQVVPRDVIGGVNRQVDHVHKPIVGQRMPLAISWQDNHSVGIAGPMRFNDRTYTGTHAPMDDLYLGSRPFGSTMRGHVKSLTVYDKFKTVEQLGADMFPPANFYTMVAAGGQSNMHGYFRSATEKYNGGEVAFVNEMNAEYPATENWLINGANNGSRITDKDDLADDNWWYDLATDTFGPRMADWETSVNAIGASNIQYFLWDQGESDSNVSKADFKTATLKIFDRMRSVAGNKPVYLTHIGRRSSFQNTNYNTVRDAQDELVSENAFVFLAPERFIQPLTDSVHLTDDGYGLHASMVGDLIFNGAEPPSISSVTRAGTAVTVTLTHGAGTDFTPTAAIAGFHFFDDGTEITISSAIRTDATTITLTLASAPTGVETIYYGYGTLFDEVATFGDLVVDNSAKALPLEHLNGALPYYANSPDKFAGLVIYHDSDKSTSPSERSGLANTTYNALQATTSLQPAVIADRINNKDALKFDTINDTMFIENDATLSAIKDNTTIEFVIEGTPSSGFKVLYRNDNNGNGLAIQNDGTGGNGSVSNRMFIRVTTDASSAALNVRVDDVFDGGRHHCVLRLDNGQADFFLDGAKIDLGTYLVGTNGFGASANWQIHNGDNLHDYLFAVYDNNLSDVDINKKWLYAKEVWTLAVSIPALVFASSLNSMYLGML